METLSNKLQHYLKEQKITPTTLANNCHINRSTMLQYIHGTRALKKEEHLERIMTRLSLTIHEQKELLELFEIEKIGYDCFLKRKKVEEFIRSLPSLNQKPDNITWKLMEKNIPIPSSGYISNRLELTQKLFYLLSKANEKDEQINILMQPQKVSLLNILMQPGFKQSKINITHIICLDNLKNNSSGENIDRYHILIQYFLLLNQYQPFYFYGNTKERFELSNPFPYFISTKDWALQISSDENTGILHTDLEVVKGFQKLFSKILGCCRPLGATFNGLGSEIDWYKSYITPETFQDAIELCTGLCSTQFWDSLLINTYLNPQLSGAEQIKSMLPEYCKTLYKSKKGGKVWIILNPVYVQEFMQTGWFKEYPKVLFSGPLNKRHRKIILERVLKACEEGWYQICLLDETLFPLQYRWELCANKETVTIQYFHQEHFRTLFIQEYGFVKEMYEYLESLYNSKNSVSGQTAINQLRNWIKQYLS